MNSWIAWKNFNFTKFKRQYAFNLEFFIFYDIFKKNKSNINKIIFNWSWIFNSDAIYFFKFKLL